MNSLLTSITTAWMNADSLAVANHLWQSTAFACVAWLLTLALRNNRAAVRYCIWLAASLKFLLPFSLLIAGGAALRSLLPAPPVVQPEMTMVIEQVAQPFLPAVPSAVVTTAPQASSIHVNVPLFLAILWACGAAFVLLRWTRRWVVLRAIVRNAQPVTLSAAVPVLSTEASIEPGIFGIVRPVLLLPAGIEQRLTPAELQAIVAHEMCHVERRDNLTYALHMLVETAFWFHPITWWIGKRLIEERERACDEAVLLAGQEAEVYATGILNVCRLYAETSLPCVSGVTGADLKQRIVRIMSERVASRMTPGKRLLLLIAGVLVLAAPMVQGFIPAPPQRVGTASVDATAPSAAAAKPPAFEVASVRPHPKDKDGIVGFISEPGGRVSVSDVSVEGLLHYALGVADYQITGIPEWAKNSRFDISAVPPDSSPSRAQTLRSGSPTAEQQQMLLALLTERFGFKFHREMHDGPVYLLRRGSGALQLKTPEHPERDSDPRGAIVMKQGGIVDGEAFGSNLTMAGLAQVLSRGLRRTVLDETGLKGTYDFHLDANDPGNRDYDQAAFDCILRLGLKLVSGKGPVETIVIDHIEPPTDNSAMDAPSQSSGAAVAKGDASVPPTTAMPTFDVATIRPVDPTAVQKFIGVMDQPDGIDAENVTLAMLMRNAYGFTKFPLDEQITGLPAWAKTQKYNLIAKVSPAEAEELKTLSAAQQRERLDEMIRSLLAERFHLRLHLTTKQISGYALTVAKGGFKLKPWQEGDAPLRRNSKGEPMPGSTFWFERDGSTTVQEVTMQSLAVFLTSQAFELGSMIVDRTGLAGMYSFKLDWSPSRSMKLAHPNLDAPADDTRPLITVLQQDLGLQLQKSTVTADILVIDHIERPSPN